jgi:hypothetical protein
MADPYEIWRQAEGKSVQKSVRTFWPELAAALEQGIMGRRGEQADRLAMRPQCEIGGPHCSGLAAGATASPRQFACIPCWGGRGKFVRNPAWDLRAKRHGEDVSTAQERWDRWETGGR